MKSRTPSPPTRRLSSTNTRQPSRLPIGLQIAARLVDGSDADWRYVRERLIAADRAALAILTDPLRTLEPEGTWPAVTRVAETFGAAERASAIETAIGDGHHDPRALITDLSVPWANAGLFLGLCLGWRLSGTLAGTDGAR